MPPEPAEPAAQPEPPGPRTPALVQTVLFLARPTAVLAAGHRRYGPVFRLRFAGAPPEVFATTAALAEQIYAVDAGGGRAGEVRRQVLEPVVGRHSLLSLDGEPWRRHRKLLSPPLHGRAISAYREEIARIAAEQIGRWPVGTPFGLRDRMQDITLEVILRLVFGISEGGRLDQLRTLIPALIDTGASTAVLMMPPRLRAWTERSPLLRRLPFLPTTRFFTRRAQVDAILYEVIAQRRSTPEPGATDVLSRLLAARDEDGRPMSDQELRDELITMLLAGHETTATALAWAFERLLRNETALSRLRGELAAGEERYLEAVVKEALRARPVVYDAPRLLDAPLRLGDYQVPAGWFAAPLISLIHHDPVSFPQPDEFRPERFLEDDQNGSGAAVNAGGGSGSGAEGVARANRAWMPFGGGRRYCVGAQLALLEMRVIIAEVLARVELTAPDPAPETPKMKHVTFVPARKTRVVVRARREAERPAAPKAT